MIEILAAIVTAQSSPQDCRESERDILEIRRIYDYYVLGCMGGRARDCSNARIFQGTLNLLEDIHFDNCLKPQEPSG